MTQHRTLLLLLLALLFGGAGVWLAIGDGDTESDTRVGSAAIDATPADEITPLEGADNEFDDLAADKAASDDLPLSAESITGIDKESDVSESPTDPKRTNRTSQGSPNQPAQPAKPVKRPSNVKTPTQPKPKKKRKLTHAEREEARRVKSGRPALQNRLSRTPTTTGSVGKLEKSPEQEKWEEQWYSEGFTPPEMTPTPVRGKIMSQQAREGLSKATVALISFFPLDGVAGGTLLPVITEFTTDDNGFFSGDIPASKLAPLNYAPVALAVTWENHLVLAGMPINTLEVGKQNEFGIFWAPELPYTLDANALQFSGELTVVATGELDPQRWHGAKQAETFAYFPTYKVATENPEQGETGPQQGHATVVGTWDGKDMPYVTLISDGKVVQTRRPAKSNLASNKSNGNNIPAPFAELVFENDSLTPVGGQVVNADGAGIPNAVVTTVGGNVSQSVLTDMAGWFFFSDPPETTNALNITHDGYVENQISAHPGDTNINAVLGVPRPRINLFVLDKTTQMPITDLSVRVIGLNPWGKNAGKPMTEAFTQLTSTDGNFLLEWQYAIQSITLEKIAYFPKTIADPSQAQEATGLINIDLAPSRKLEVTPRDYTAVERDDRWFKDPKNGVGIYTAWANHWIEWEVDYGDEPEEGEEGGSFDILLGCTNHGIVDNEYQFMVDVYVDGKKQGSLTITADSLNERTGRLSLGKLSGLHTIRLVWTNDKWIPQQLDANIRYSSMKFLEQP